MLKKKAFLTVLAGAMLMALAVSCNGGGEADSEGDTYTPGGGG
jgi:hypothetical protein